MSAGIAIGFDLGETLLTYADTPLSWASLYRPALERSAVACHAQPDEAGFARAAAILALYNTRLHPRTAEIGASEIFTEILESWSLSTAKHLSAAIAAFFGFFQQRLVSYPESSTVLAELRAASFRLGVLTDVPYGMPKEFVLRDLRSGGLETAIDVLLTSCEVGWRKPAAQGFQALAKKLGTTTDRLWFVGNEEKDIAGSLAAGATAVLIDRENRQPCWGQTHTIHDLREIRALL